MFVEKVYYEIKKFQSFEKLGFSVKCFGSLIKFSTLLLMASKSDVIRAKN